ncbi:SDR family oxidoreductase [Gluconacetobacter tumulicola]|uniref:SDR family oxidoreductase n=1 Tax=Gluconacetobacter tumulicola TaxID=1017177 RepID=A0A7W4PB52_9PROT|nr:SDR family oxidoreductase [Gluconacetobacter tumulicola]MBB2180765.1 SDR family oxidoreductase [Gluconacetobacter tumulicola]
MSLKDKRVVVLGGTSGIGFAVAAAAAREGARVVIGSSRRQRVDAALSELPDGSEGHVVDLTDHGAVERFFNELGAYDHLVYTAGEPLLLRSLATIDLSEARRFFETRYWGAYAAAKFGSAGVRPGGSIVLTSGTASQRPGPGWSAVAGALAAMEGLCRALAIELAPIRVNVVTPGLVRTELWREMDELERDQLYKGASENLLVRHVGEVHEIAQTYIYLMNQTYVTGQTMITDGGASLV